jgi:hypothetical protein
MVALAHWVSTQSLPKHSMIAELIIFVIFYAVQVKSCQTYQVAFDDCRDKVLTLF